MDTSSLLLMTPIQKRLQTFNKSPLPNENLLSLSNSPMKLAEAGFIRHENATLDEVECSSCGVKYNGWSGESPLAVHRTLNPKCPFLNTPPESTTAASQTETPENELNAPSEVENYIKSFANARRQLFPEFETSEPSVLKVADIEHPFLPKIGDYLMLFESHRLLTYKNPLSPEAAVYAEAGFVYNVPSRGVICVFCSGELNFEPTNMSFLDKMHAEISPVCPFVNLYDVGNVSMDAERRIREKVRAQHLSLRSKISDNKVKYIIKHPEFEGKEVRLGTFSSWPKLMASVFPANVMAESGFYYSGFMDKVKCFSCGVGLYNWCPEADPSKQHAKASPQCVYMAQSKGKEFVELAQNEELLVEADHEDTISQSPEQDAASSTTEQMALESTTAATSPAMSTPSSCTSSLPGSPVLDLEAIKAAMACQYTLEQISHAVIKFFVLSCGQYPNSELLVGTLKAADENYVRLCEKSQELQETKAKEAQFEAKEAQYQEEKAQYQAKEAAYQQEIQAKDRELQRTTFEMQWRDLEVRTELEQQFVGQIQHQNELLEQKDQALEQKDQVIEQNHQVIEQKDQVIEQKDQVIEHKDQALEHRAIQLQMKNKEVEDLQRHIKSLMLELEKREQGIPASDDDEESSTSSSDMEQTSESDSSSNDEFPVASCKVCLTKPSQIVFLPCKHLCCCEYCASRLHGKNCPICRERNLGFEKVYVI